MGQRAQKARQKTESLQSLVHEPKLCPVCASAGRAALLLFTTSLLATSLELKQDRGLERNR